MDTLFELMKMIGTWFLIVFGWLVVSDQQESRDLAKTISSRLSEMRKELLVMQKLAIEHHTSGFDESRVRDLLRLIGDFSGEESYLQRCGFLSISMSMGVVRLRQAITSNNMDQSSYRKYGAGSQLVSDIEDARSALDRDLMAASHKIISKPRTLRDSISVTFRNKL